MLNNQNVQNIQCPQCGGQLAWYGGQQVLSITCQYCGSVLDTKDNFKVLDSFLKKKRPSFPFQLGMKITWNKVEFILIGIVEYTHKDSWGTYPWVEGLLFSPVQGYLWLIFENGHFVIGRESKKRASNEPKKILGANVYTQELALEDRHYRIFERGTARITYVEGELTWVAKAQDKVEYLDAVLPPHLYSIQQTETEREYFTGEYVPAAEVFKAFGLAQTVASEGVYCCQPYKVSPLVEGMTYSGKIYTGIVLFLIIWFAVLYRGNTIYEKTLSVKKESLAATTNSNDVVERFLVNKPSNLMVLKIHASLSDSWAQFEINIFDDQKNLVTTLRPGLSYYSGYEGGESWTEGSRSTKTYFTVPKAGEYEFDISYEGGSGESDWGAESLKVAITIDENTKPTRYLLGCLALMLFFAISNWISKYRFERKRWADYHESQRED